MQRSSLNMLVVEDHEDTAKIIRRLLVNQGHAVALASNGADALQLAQQSRFQLLISDIGLPGDDGFSVLAALLRMYPIKSIAVTGYDPQYLEPQTQIGAFDRLLIKPYSLEKLLELIDQIFSDLPNPDDREPPGTSSA